MNTQMNGWAGMLGATSKAFLDSSQKKKNGSANAGTNGINLPKPTVSPTNNWMSDWKSKINPQAGNTTSGTSNPTGSKMTTPTGTATGTGTQQGFAYSGDYVADAQKLLTQLQQITSTPFSYNKDTDPNYAAAKQSLEQGAALAKDQTYADMADRGILNSSVTTGQLGSIEQQSVQSLAQVVPGLEANAYNRYQTGVNNQANVITQLLGQLNYQQGFEADQRWREADVTGTYESPEIQKLMQTIIGAKQGWAGTKDPTERLNFQKSADSARAALAQLTGRTTKEVDAMFGSKVGLDLAQGNFGMGGIETMTAKGMRLEGERYDAGVTYQAGRDKVADAQVKEQNKQAWAQINKPTGGGSGSGGLTFSQLLDGNTNRMMTTMLGEITSMDQVPAWIKANNKAILEAGVDPSKFHDTAEKFFSSNKPAGSDLSPSELNSKVLDAAYKDPDWERADTVEKQQTIIAKWRKYYNPPQQPDLLDSALNAGKKWFPWAFK